VQWVETHAPLPSHTVPPFSLQATPTARFTVPQLLVVRSQTSSVQPVGAGQSLAVKHSTHLPLPSQTTPPWSLHALADAALDVAQAPFLHAARAQVVPVAGQSVAGFEHAGPPPAAETPALPESALPPATPEPPPMTPRPALPES
jgi:hypothetical protein